MVDTGAQCHVIPESICKDMGFECASKKAQDWNNGRDGHGRWVQM